MSIKYPTTESHIIDHKKIPSRLFIWFIPVIFALTITFFTSYFEEETILVIKKLLRLTTHNLGFIFLLYGFACVSSLFYVAFSPLGSIHLGNRGDPPQYNDKEWMSLMFCAGLGISVIMWGFVESIYYYKAPPYQLEKNSSTSMEWAHMIPLFHWGISAWSIYCIPTVALAYGFYVKKIDNLSFSALLSSLTGISNNGILSKVVDIIVVFCILGGMCTSLGIITPVLSALMSSLMGWQNDMALNLKIILTLALLFGLSTGLGMDRGLKAMSFLNTYLAILFILFVLIAGPTTFILSISTNSIGLMISNFFRMSFYLDPVEKSGWPQDWTIFYWAWWIAYTPMMGIFVTKISRGRTLKQLILGMCLGGSLGCWFILSILGGYSLYLQKSGALNLTQLIGEKGFDATVISILTQLPFPEIVSVIFLLLAFVFTATTFDSSAYTLAELSSTSNEVQKDPNLKSRLLWCLFLVLFSLNILFIDAFEAIKLSSTLVALPMIPISIIGFVSFLKDAKKNKL